MSAFSQTYGAGLWGYPCALAGPPTPPPHPPPAFYALDQPGSLWAVSSLSPSLNITAAINSGNSGPSLAWQHCCLMQLLPFRGWRTILGGGGQDGQTVPWIGRDLLSLYVLLTNILVLNYIRLNNSKTVFIFFFFYSRNAGEVIMSVWTQLSFCFFFSRCRSEDNLNLSLEMSKQLQPTLVIFFWLNSKLVMHVVTGCVSMFCIAGGEKPP